jgi:tetratricopeptide (TPR) repeat protein
MSKNPEKSIKSSSADYPVDPVERSNQEARLKKAAAAGASASSSPISALKFQLPSSSPSSQKAAESQTTLSKSAASTEPAPEALNGRSATQITNDEVVAELRKISAWADLQRKITKWSLFALMAFVAVAIGVFTLMDRHLETTLVPNLTAHQLDWYEVDRNVRQGDFEKAIAIGEELILKTPQYPEAHERLARAYLAAGNLEKAKEHYAEAFRLFPCEENEKLLNAIEKRIKADKP